MAAVAVTTTSSMPLIESSPLESHGITEVFQRCMVAPESHYRQVFGDQEMRGQFRDFLRNVFMQIDDGKFFVLIDDILKNPDLNDEDIYKELLQRIQKEAGFSPVKRLIKILQSLNGIKKDLSDQVKVLMAGEKVNGYVECGYTGRLMKPLRAKLDMTGPSYVINDFEAVTDYIECGFPRPYDKFLQLNNYEPIAEDQIPTASVDLLSIFPGVHHCKAEKLPAFLASIKRILRPGGTIILMDHDAKTKKMQVLVDIVHSVFNAATGVPPEKEKGEIRNFQSCQNWKNILAESGFEWVPHDPLIRQGDSTLNTTMRFRKTPENKEEFEVTALREPGVVRPASQTYMTQMELFYVRLAEDYATFCENNVFVRYPHFRRIPGIWKTIFNSWVEGRKHDSFKDMATSSYLLMNLFIGSFATVEQLTKGITGLLLSPLVSRQQTAVTHAYAHFARNYAGWMLATPFYDYNFKNVQPLLLRAAQNSWTERRQHINLLRATASMATITDLACGTFASIELGLNHVVCAPIKWAFSGVETARIRAMVESPTLPTNEGITVKGQFEDLYDLELPRYVPFKDILVDFARRNIHVRNVGGQTQLVIDIKVPKGRDLPRLNGSQHINIVKFESYMLVAYDVKLENLSDFVHAVDHDNLQIEIIHDL